MCVAIATNEKEDLAYLSTFNPLTPTVSCRNGLLLCQTGLSRHLFCNF